MTMLAQRMNPERSQADTGPGTKASARLLQRIRAEFLEMPGLKLTLAQAQRVFGLDARQTKRLLWELLAEGFLACDARGAYLRRGDTVDAPGPRATEDVRPGREHVTATCAHHSPAVSGRPFDDLLDAVGIEMPCLVCGGSYRLSLRKIRLSQLMMDAGCDVRHFSECPPGALAHLIDPDVLAEFDAAVRRITAAAADAGGCLVGPAGSADTRF